jgi:hypothetical protein
MLLPDIYHGPSVAKGQNYGALKGELPIFLALIALSLPGHHLPNVLPQLYVNGHWQSHTMAHGRKSCRPFNGSVLIIVHRGTQARRRCDGL